MEFGDISRVIILYKIFLSILIFFLHVPKVFFAFIVALLVIILAQFNTSSSLLKHHLKMFTCFPSLQVNKKKTTTQDIKKYEKLLQTEHRFMFRIFLFICLICRFKGTVAGELLFN